MVVRLKTLSIAGPKIKILFSSLTYNNVEKTYSNKTYKLIKLSLEIIFINRYLVSWVR